MSEGGGDSSMLVVVVLIVASMSSCCMAAGVAALALYKNPNFLKDLLGGTISTSTPGGSPAPAPLTAAECDARAQTECAGIRGPPRGTCISRSKRACAASGGSTGAPVECGESVAELFADRDYGGSSVKLKCGEYINLSSYGMNDKVSSMKIPPNLKVIAYNNADYKGDTGVFRNNIAYVGSPFGNEITAVKVVPVTASNPPVYKNEWIGDTA